MIRALVLALALLPLPSYAADMVASGTLVKVNATGEVRRAPDVAMVGVGVITTAPDAKAALAANAAQMTRVIDAVRKAGVAEKDIQTTGVNLQPQYAYRENQAPSITGYQAQNRVSVTVRDIGKTGDVLDAFVGAGANQVDGPSFTLDNPEAALDEARKQALDRAQARAELYAKSLGKRVARVASIDETGSGFEPPRPMPMMKAMVADQASTPVMPGEQVHSVSLFVVFELE